MDYEFFFCTFAETMNEIDSNSGEIVMYQPDETIRLEVRMEGDTMWLSANQMALLFDRDEKTIRKHINNVFAEQEVPKDINTHFLRVDGVKQFSRAHDRFLLIDDEVYHLGASIKDLGKKWFAFTQMHDLTPSMLYEHLSDKGGSYPPPTT